MSARAKQPARGAADRFEAVTTKVGSGDSQYEVIEVPNRLAEKVTVSDQDLSTRLERAEQSLGTLQNDFQAWIRTDVQALLACVASAKADPDKARRALMDLHRRTHDMKGQGQMFGYPLLTEVGESLTRFLSRIKTVGKREIDVAELHVNALSLILLNQLKGDGGAQGRELAASLQAAVQKVLSA